MTGKRQSVKGQVISKPHLTRWGYWYVFLYLIAPFLGALTALDGLLFLLFHYGFDHCYGLLCYL